MKVRENMKLGALYDLRDRMGTGASLGEARRMRNLLLDAGHDETNTVPDDEWQRLLAQAAVEPNDE